MKSTRRIKRYRKQDTNLKSLPNEVWVSIAGYNGDYQVSTMGRIKSLKRSPKIMRQSYKGDYLGVTLCNSGINKDFHTHKLVAITYLQHTPNGFELVCDHINYLREDNRLENIQVITQKENMNREGNLNRQN